MTYPFSTASRLSRRRLIVLGAGVGLLAGLAPPGMAAANPQPLRIALPLFIQTSGPGAATAGNLQIALEVTHIIDTNLRRSGRFALVDPSAYVGKTVAIDALPYFPDWRAFDAQVLVVGRLSRQSDERLRAEFRLWDVAAGQHLVARMYSTTWDDWRRIAHIISDAIHEQLTGENGIFDVPEAEITKP